MAALNLHARQLSIEMRSRAVMNALAIYGSARCGWRLWRAKLCLLVSYRPLALGYKVLRTKAELISGKEKDLLGSWVLFTPAGSGAPTGVSARLRERLRGSACATASGLIGRRRPGSSCAELGRLQAARGPPRCTRARPTPGCRRGRCGALAARVAVFAIHRRACATHALFGRRLRRRARRVRRDDGGRRSPACAAPARPSRRPRSCGAFFQTRIADRFVDRARAPPPKQPMWRFLPSASPILRLPTLFTYPNTRPRTATTSSARRPRRSVSSHGGVPGPAHHASSSSSSDGSSRRRNRRGRRHRQARRAAGARRSRRGSSSRCSMPSAAKRRRSSGRRLVELEQYMPRRRHFACSNLLNGELYSHARTSLAERLGGPERRTCLRESRANDGAGPRAQNAERKTGFAGLDPKRPLTRCAARAPPATL